MLGALGRIVALSKAAESVHVLKRHDSWSHPELSSCGGIHLPAAQNEDTPSALPSRYCFLFRHVQHRHVPNSCILLSSIVMARLCLAALLVLAVSPRDSRQDSAGVATVLAGPRQAATVSMLEPGMHVCVCVCMRARVRQRQVTLCGWMRPRQRQSAVCLKMEIMLM